MDIWQKYLSALNKMDWAKALSAMESLSKKDPGNPQAFLKMGDAFQRLGKTNGAVTAYHEAASIFLKKGFSEKALAVYKIILRLSPEDQLAASEAAAAMRQLEDASRQAGILQPADAPGILPASEAPAPEAPAPETPAPAAPTPEAAWSIGFFLPEPAAPAPEIPAPKTALPASVPPAQGMPVIFSSLTAKENGRIWQQAAMLSFEPGQTIVAEGDTGDSIHYIVEGTVTVLTSIRGRQIELATLSAGDIFGEVAFLTGRPRTATVAAKSAVRVLEIGGALMEEITWATPALIEELQDFYQIRTNDTVAKTINSMRPGPGDLI